MSIKIRPVTCGSEDHARPVAAVAWLYWPTGRFNPATPCAGHLKQALRDSREEGVPVEVWPLGREPDHGLGFGAWRRAPDCDRCKDTGRFHENNTEAHCGCKRGRRMSELWYAEKHGYGHPDMPDPEPPEPWDEEGPPF